MLPVSLAPVEGTWLGPVSALFYHTPSNYHHITLSSFFPYHLNWFCLWIFYWVHLFPNPLFLAVGSALWELFSLFHEKWFLFDANFSVCFLLMERWVPRGLFLKKKKKIIPLSLAASGLSCGVQASLQLWCKDSREHGVCSWGERV